MKTRIKLLAVISAFLCTLNMFAQSSSSNEVWPHFDESSLKEMVKSMMSDDYSKALHLEEWGFMNAQGKRINPHACSEKNQTWLLLPDNMQHINTDDGTFYYDAKIKGDKIILTNQSKLTADGMKNTNPNYKGWIKLVSVKTKPLRYLTVDNLGVYRIFTSIPFSIDEMMELTAPN